MAEAQSFTSLAQTTKRLWPVREALLGVLGIVGLGSTRVDISHIIDQPTPESITTGLATNEQVLGVIGQTQVAANDPTFIDSQKTGTNG